MDRESLSKAQDTQQRNIQQAPVWRPRMVRQAALLGYLQRGHCPHPGRVERLEVSVATGFQSQRWMATASPLCLLPLATTFPDGLLAPVQCVDREPTIPRL